MRRQYVDHRCPDHHAARAYRVRHGFEGGSELYGVDSDVVVHSIAGRPDHRDECYRAVLRDAEVQSEVRALVGALIAPEFFWKTRVAPTLLDLSPDHVQIRLIPR